LDYSDEQTTMLEPSKADQFINLAVQEVLKNDDLLLDYLAWPDIWLDDKLPGVLKAINKEHKLVPMEFLGSEHHIGSLMGLRNAFRDTMGKMRNVEDAKQGKRRSEGG
jgi:hypothetical protein